MQPNKVAEIGVKVLKTIGLKVIALFKKLKLNTAVLNIKLITNISNKNRPLCFENKIFFC